MITPTPSPEVPLPEPPWRVLAISKLGGVFNQTVWWIWSERSESFFHAGTYIANPEWLTVIPHPMNDARAIAIITQAQGAESHER